MGIFCITRKKFLDRKVGFAELELLAEMLREWSVLCGAESGVWRCEARVYCVARGDLKTVETRLSQQLVDAEFEASDPDELWIAGHSTQLGDEIDLAVWKAVLNDPTVRRGCVILRLVFNGKVVTSEGSQGAGKSAFVVCGEPIEDGLNVKAIWHVGGDEAMGLVYRSVAWDLEQIFVGAFDDYVMNREKQPHDAAGQALAMFGTEAKHLFVTGRQEWLTMKILRHWAELPDDRGPWAFIRRAGICLVIGSAFVAGAYWSVSKGAILAVSLLLIGGYFLYLAGRIVLKKLGRIRAYYTKMRAGLGKLYSGPVNYALTDLSADQSPALLKYSAETEALGGKHLCDVCITTARGVLDGNRVYGFGDCTMAIGLLRKTENLQFFPAKPVLLCKTWFVDGRRHYTQNTPKYRKRSLMHVTGRCLPDGGGPAQVLELQERHVEKLIASGAVVRQVEQTGGEVLKGMEKEHEESRAGWERSPYSWGDAVHDAFKVCRREFLGE